MLCRNTLLWIQWLRKDSPQAHDLPAKGHKLMIQKLINDSLVSSWGWMVNEQTGWPLLMIWISFFEHSLHAATYSERSGAAHRGEGEGKHPSLFFPASQMEKQFITLSDSLSKTDMIKNNIKWIMFSSDWYHYNCQPDFCRQETRTNKNTHTHFVGVRQTHRRGNFMPVCLSNMSPLPAPDGSPS